MGNDARIIKSDATLRALRPPESGREEWRDQRVSGLRLSVTNRGSMTWYLIGRLAGTGRVVRLNMGPYIRGIDGQLRKVRREAAQAADKLRAGIHPDQEREEARALAARRKADTFSVVRDRFLARHASQLAPRTGKAYKNALSGPRLAEWESRPIHEITRRDIIELLDRIAIEDKAPVMANRMRAYLGAFFNWAVETDVLTAAPTDRVRKPAIERPRDRWLSADELRAVWAAAESLGYPFGPFVHLLIVTGQRREEVATMRRSDIDGDRWVQTMNKAHRVHVVPLSPLALEILESVPQTVGSDYVFTTNGSASISGFSRAKRRIDAELGDMEPWTLHDLRRSVATHMRELRISRDTVSAILNHAPRGVTGRHYDQWQALDEKTEALNAWASRLREITGTAPDNVVALR